MFDSYNLYKSKFGHSSIKFSVLINPNSEQNATEQQLTADTLYSRAARRQRFYKLRTAVSSRDGGDAATKFIFILCRKQNAIRPQAASNRAAHAGILSIASAFRTEVAASCSARVARKYRKRARAFIRTSR